MKKGGGGTFYLIETFNAVAKVVESKVDDLCFHLLPDLTLVAQKELLFDLPKEKYLILSVSVPYCRNDTDCVLNITLQLTQDRSCVLSIAPNAKGVLPKEEREVYKPNFMNLGFNLIPYIGMENSILNAHSGVICEKGDNPQIELFKQSDPFLCFIREHKQHFPEIEIWKTQITDVCAVHKQGVKRVQSLFQKEIFPLFEYSNTQSLRIDWTPQKLEQQPSKRENGFAIAMVLVKVDYIAIKQEVPKFACKINNLGI